MGRLRPAPASAGTSASIALPRIDPHGGGTAPHREALAARRSSRGFASEPLPMPVLGGLLWARRSASTGPTATARHRRR